MSETTMQISQLAQGLNRRRTELMLRSRQIAADLRRSREPQGGFADQVAQRYNDQVLAGILSSAEDELRQIDNALRRIADGHYEICARCGSGIPPARLVAMPYTDHCATCVPL